MASPGRYIRLFACAAVVCAAYLATPALFDLDDAYIALHSAQVAVDGVDPVFGAPALTGATSPAYVAFIAALLRLGVPGLLALRIAAAAGAAAYVLALWRLGGALSLPAPRRSALVALTLVSGLVLMQATNGLETGWALALLTCLIAEAFRERPLVTAAGAALLPWLRPDLAPAAIALTLYAWRGQPRRRIAAGAAAALAVGIPLLLWLHHDTAAWIPQTIQAKTFFFAEMCQPLTTKAAAAYVAIADYLVMTAPLAICAIGLWRERLGRYGLAAVALTLAAFLLRFPGGLTHNHSRYLYAIVTPWLTFGAALRFGRTGTSAPRWHVAAPVGAALLLFPFIQPDRRMTAAELRDTSAWVEQHVPADAVLLVHDAGAISVFARHRAVDLVGLNTAGSIAAHRRWTLPSCGGARASAVADIARTSHASYAVFVSDWDANFNLRSGLAAHGFALTTLRTPQPGIRGYTVYQIDPVVF